MKTVRTVNVLASLFLGAIMLAPQSSAAVEKATELSSECVSPEAKKALSECPKGPKTFDIKKKRAVAFKSAPPPRDVKKREDSSKPRDASVLQQFADRDTRTTRLKARARALLINEIQGLERLLRETKKNSPDRPQLVRRLAEGYVELEAAGVRDYNAAEMIAGDKKTSAGEKSKQRSAAGQAKKIAEASRQNAIKYYSMMKDQYPNYSKLDEVLYYLAYEYEQAKDLQNARKVYFELIEKAPQSPYIPNAYLAFGELYFQEAQGDPSKFDLAAAAYKEVIKYQPPKNKVYGYARYKLGYVHWNKGEYAETLNQFKAVIEYGDKFSDLPNAKQLAKSARRDLIPVYGISGNPTKAYSFFKPLSGDSGNSEEKTIDMLNELGFAYLDTGHYAEGILLYRDLMTRDKGDRYCHYQTQITGAVSASKSSDKETIRKEMDTQLEIRKAFIADSHSDKSKLECSNRTAELLAETGMSWHLEAVGSGGVRGTGDKKTMQDVYPNVRDYLKVWQLDTNGLVIHRKGDWDWEDWGENIDATVLDSAANATSNLNTTIVAAQPMVTNFAVISAQLREPGGLGVWALGTNGDGQIQTALTNLNSLLENTDTNFGALLINLANITSNLNAQVQANTNLLGGISKTVSDADDLVQGLKRHWLLRSAFKTKATNAPAKK